MEATTVKDNCTHCGACRNHDRCACCGHCRNCGQFIAAPVWPYQQPIWVIPQYPYAPYYNPIIYTTTTGGVGGYVDVPNTSVGCSSSSTYVADPNAQWSYTQLGNWSLSIGTQQAN